MVVMVIIADVEEEIAVVKNAGTGQFAVNRGHAGLLRNFLEVCLCSHSITNHLRQSIGEAMECHGESERIEGRRGNGWWNFRKAPL